MSQCASSVVGAGAGFPVVRPGLTVSAATAGDHAVVFDLLQRVFQRPSAGDFQSQLEDPFYEPNQRLVVRDGCRIVAHARLCEREMQFGSTVWPVATLTELATLPAWRGQGCAAALVAETERRMRAGGAVLGLVRTDVPEFFLKRGWVLGGTHSWSEASPRDILAQLSVLRGESAARLDRQASERLAGERRDERRPGLSTRIWRQVERGALARIYSQSVAKAYGPLVRSDQYWDWMVSRQTYDAIYVTVQGPDRRELDDRAVVAYAVLKGSRVVELFGATRSAQLQLLERICGEAIERDAHHVLLDLAPDHPLHRLVVAGGGQQHRRECVGGQMLLAKVFEPWRLLDELAPELASRAASAGWELPWELSVEEEGGVCRRLAATRRGVRWEDCRATRATLRCAPGALGELLLGSWNFAERAARGRWRASSSSTLRLAETLFPRLPLWRPPWEEMTA